MTRIEISRLVSINDDELIISRKTIRKIRKLLGPDYKKSWLKLKSKNGKLYSAPLSAIKLWASSETLKLESLPGSSSNDIVPGIYEGGFKVWECCKDLVKFVAESSTISKLIQRESLNILELGAGSCLPSISFLKRLIDEQAACNYSIHVQDYNWQVLLTSGLLNLYANLNEEDIKSLIRQRQIQFFAGDWKDFKSETNYDFILMSETIYNRDSYESLHDILEKQLCKDGIVVLATKETYFGCTGGLDSWIEFIDSKKKLRVHHSERTCSQNIPRSIIIFKFL